MGSETTAYTIREVPAESWRAALERARGEGRTIRWVLLQAVAAYAEGRWTPEPTATAPAGRRKGKG
jgi:hypothetical protein